LDNKLKTLVDYYEEEKKRLLEIINGYTNEFEYEFAHFHAQALFQVNAKLQTLYSLQDRKHDEKRMKQNNIRNLEERIKEETSAYLKRVLLKKMEQKKLELEKLTQVSEPVNENNTVFNETLNNLLETKITGFTLFLSQEDRFQLDFTYKANVLKAVFPYVKQHIKTSMLSDEAILVLHSLGFVYNCNNCRLLLFITGDKSIIKYELEWRLAKIVFDLFNFSSFEGKSCISVKDKTRL
jgi:hypothetical protein